MTANAAPSWAGRPEDASAPDVGRSLPILKLPFEQPLDEPLFEPLLPPQAIATIAKPASRVTALIRNPLIWFPLTRRHPSRHPEVPFGPRPLPVRGACPTGEPLGARVRRRGSAAT